MKKSLEEGEGRGRETSQEAVATHLIPANDDATWLGPRCCQGHREVQSSPCSNNGDTQLLAQKCVLEVQLTDVLKGLMWSERSIKVDKLEGWLCHLMRCVQ